MGEDKLTRSFRFQNREILDTYVVLAVTNTDGVIKHVSTNLCNAFGYKEEEILDKPYEFLIKQDSLETFRGQFDDAKSSKHEWKGEVKHASKADETIWTDTIIRPLLDDEGVLVGFMLASSDITQEKRLEKINEENMLKKSYSKSIIDFMPSLSGAVLLRTSSGLSKVLWIMFGTIVFLIIWASFSEIDETVKASGKIIPSDNINTISSFTGGVIDKIYVKDGQKVQEGDLLVKIQDSELASELSKNSIHLVELKAKRARLKAEIEGEKLEPLEDIEKNYPEIMQNEISLYESNVNEFNSSQQSIKEKIAQKRSELQNAIEKERVLSQNYNLMREEARIKQDLAKDGIISSVDAMKSQRELNSLESELSETRSTIPSLKSTIDELNLNYDQNFFNYQSEAKNELTEVDSKIKNLEETINSLDTQITSTNIKAPISGVIKEVYATTRGSAIQPGRPIVDIVPDSKYFIAEIKVKPEDIGFLYDGQKVSLKVRTYDFSIYGGLDGEISYISADSIFDEKNKEYEYTVFVRSKKDYVGSENLKIKPGMSVDADIITGKRTVMDYILKPIMKAKQNALSEK